MMLFPPSTVSLRRKNSMHFDSIWCVREPFTGFAPVLSGGIDPCLGVRSLGLLIFIKIPAMGMGGYADFPGLQVPCLEFASVAGLITSCTFLGRRYVLVPSFITSSLVLGLFLL